MPLEGVLPWLYGRTNALQRAARDLIANPVATAQQAAGQFMDAHRENERLNALAFADPRRPFQVTDKQALGTLAERTLTGPLGMAPAGMTVWHGSPHQFDKFDSSKIGTGEGAQAYGHGLYVAENPQVAAGYQAAGHRGPPLPERAWEEIGAVMRRLKIPGDEVPGESDPAMVRRLLGQHGANMTQDERALLERYAAPGTMYEVNLPDPMVERMVDWDKPLHRQAPHVRKFLQSEIGDRLGRDTYAQWIRNRPDWRDFQDNMMSHLPNEEVTARARAAGIPGVRYLDQGSRVGGAGTRNFVVFPGEENALSILRRNGQPLR